MKKLCIYLSVFLFTLLTVQAQENAPHSPRIFGFGTYYHGDGVKTLDVSGCPALEYLDCGGDNELTSLEVSRNPALRELHCGGNELTSLDVSKNPALESLDCSGNELTSLDVSRNPALKSLDCGGNELMSLDVSWNPALRSLESYNNHIPLSVLYNACNHPYVYSGWSQFDSIVLLVGEDFDLSSEYRIGQKFSNYKFWNSAGDVDEIGFIFRFNVAGTYDMGIYNKEIESVDNGDESYGWFEWYITVLEELPVGYLRLRTAVNKGEWGTAGIRGKGIYKEGEEVTLYATPRRGHRFVNWTRNDGTVFSTEAVHTFTVTEELRLTANFEKDPEDVGNETLAENAPEDGLHVYVRDRTIHLSEERGMVRVYNVAGACVYGGHATAIPVKGSGLYIVRVGERAYKAMVR